MSRNFYENNKVYECQTEKMCPGGAPGTCAENRKGVACGVCEDGFYYLDKEEIGTCAKCAGSQNWAGPVVLFAFVLVFCFLHQYLGLFISKGGNASFLFRFHTIGLTFTALQLYISMSKIQANWSDIITKLFALTNILAFDIEFIHLSCAFQTDSPVHRVITKAVALPILLMGCSVMHIVVAWVFGLQTSFERYHSGIILN